MDSEFVNAYIDRVVNEVAELTKTRILLETQLAMATKLIDEQRQKIEALELNSKPKPSKKEE